MIAFSLKRSNIIVIVDGAQVSAAVCAEAGADVTDPAIDEPMKLEELDDMTKLR